MLALDLCRWAANQSIDHNRSLARQHAMPRGETELAMAEDLALDTVQFQFNYNRALAELVLMCSACSHGPRPAWTCPPWPLRTGWGASRACACDDALPVLNCAPS